MRPVSAVRRVTSLGAAGPLGAAALVATLGAAPTAAAPAKPAAAAADAGQHMFQTPQLSAVESAG
jgi:hypothetical protein